MRTFTGGTLVLAALLGLLVHGHGRDRTEARFFKSPQDVAVFVTPSHAARRHDHDVEWNVCGNRHRNGHLLRESWDNERRPRNG